MLQTGYYTAGILLCLIGEPQNYENCLVYRSSVAYPTLKMCQEDIVSKFDIVPRMFDQEAFEVIDVKCVSWLPEKRNI